MATKALIVHHLEKEWEQSYVRYGSSFDQLVYALLDHLDVTSYNKIILTKFEDDRLGDEYNSLIYYIDACYEYAYGWDEKHDETYIEGGVHSEYVWVPDWLHQFKGYDEVYLCGAFIGECLEDMEIALNSLNIYPILIKELCL